MNSKGNLRKILLEFRGKQWGWVSFKLQQPAGQEGERERERPFQFNRFGQAATGKKERGFQSKSENAQGVRESILNLWPVS